MRLRSEVLRLSPTQWRPQVGAASVAVAHVERLYVSHPESDICHDYCPMWNSRERHSHFVIQVGLGFLGVLENFVTGTIEEGRTYNFSQTPKDDQGETILAARKAGHIITVNAPVAMLGQANWSPLRGTPAQIMQALVREVTRTRGGRGSESSGRPRVVIGNRVPGIRPQSLVQCPYLGFNGHYVVFGGNGRRAGMGYTIVGKKGKGWLSRCGFQTLDDIPSLRKATMKFLAGLSTLAHLLDLKVVGLLPTADNFQWRSLDELLGMAGSKACWPKLAAVHLRIFGPENYADRIRACLAEAGGFALLPNGAGDGKTNTPASSDSDLVVSLARWKITQTEIAKRLGITQPSVSDFMHGRRRWPERVRQEVGKMILERAAETGLGDGTAED